MKGATCFSGIGSPEAAMPEIDWRWAAEIDPFAAAVFAARCPETENLGDVLATEFLERVSYVDLLVGGPPCQAFSVAGLRKSMSDSRGNLTLRWIEIIHAVEPLWCVTENVPGWLSTKDNAFGCFLAGLVGADAPLVPTKQCGGRWTDAGLVVGPKRDAAWRILDAQYFGVPQRRRRVFVVSRHSGNGESAAAVLFEPESLRGDTAPRREAGERGAPTIESGANRTGWPRPPGTTVDTAETLIAFSAKDHGADAGEIAPTLRAMEFGETWANGGGQVAVAFGGNRQSGPLDVATAVNAHGGPHGRLDFESETFETQSGAQHAIGRGMTVRRLTPRECERLQGFPDDYTLVPYRGKPAADGPRYRAIGNSMAVPLVSWILQGIGLTTERRQR